ncbi:hypothetical protein ACFVX6_19080 [Streptomyces sp. NPDC058289]|uniref:hypothetical protein n=1 Tax=Streptomyces sp. NPDC058289 TaxID=3346425 RepID=UPI0036E2090D
MKTPVRPLIMISLTVTCAISLAGTAQAAAFRGATAPARQASAREADNGGFDKTEMMFEEAGKNGAYIHAKQWDSSTSDD